MSVDAEPNEVAAQHAIIGNTGAAVRPEHQHTTHPAAQWYPEAGMGLFIHWGLSSVLGQYDLSWGMMHNPGGKPISEKVKAYGLPAVAANVTPRKYWEQAKYFTPDRYDPDKWLSAAREAGANYAVLTTRHHDGFALWPSDYGDFSTKNYLNGRDLVKEYVEACRRNDLRVGFYYSPPDWYWNRHRMSFNYSKNDQALGLDHEPVTLPEFSTEERRKIDSDFSAYVRGQIKELLTRYGQVDLLWFDGQLPEKEKTISLDEIRELQPGIVLNDRGHGYGDYQTPECSFPKQPFTPDEWWELCYVFSDGAWGYLNHECYKPNGWLLSELGRVRAWDGNFLPNVGPDSHGELPHTFYQRMKELATWMRHSGESVKGTRGGIWPERCNVPVTRNASAWYVHIDWVCDYEIMLSDVALPKSVTYLRTGEAIPFAQKERKITFSFPKDLKTILTDVVKIIW